MPSYYVYLVSSLPMLHFGAKPPFSFARFMGLCRGLVSDDDIAVLDAVGSGREGPYEKRQPAVAGWLAFDRALRNELVKIRASRRHIDPSRYLRQDGYADPSISHMALNSYRNPSVMEAERMLDEERWAALDEIAAGHYFDLDVVVVYAYKLLILHKWEKIKTADGPRLLEMALTGQPA